MWEVFSSQYFRSGHPQAARTLIGVRTHQGLQVWEPRPLGTCRPRALGLCAWAAWPLIRVRTHLGFQVWAPRPLIGVHTYLGVWACEPRQPGC